MYVSEISYVFPVSFPNLYVLLCLMYPCRNIIDSRFPTGVLIVIRVLVFPCLTFPCDSTKRSRSQKEFPYILHVGNLQNAPCEHFVIDSVLEVLCNFNSHLWEPNH